MNDSNPSSSPRPGRPAWNKGKMPGPKPPLRPGRVWVIRAKLQIEKRTRDLAMFNLAIDSKLRGCDLMALRVDDVAPNSYAIDRPTEEDRPSRSLRADRTDAPGSGRLSSYHRPQVRRLFFPGPPRARSIVDDPPVRAPGIRMGGRYRSRPFEICDAQHEADEGDFDLPPHSEPPRGAAASGPPEN